MVWRRGQVLTVALLAVACREPPAPPAEPANPPAPWFVEVAAEAGLDFVHRSGHDGERFLLPESVAGGGALFDIDGDGWLDVYLVQSAEVPGRPPGNRLYRNLAGDGDGLRFADVTDGSGAGDRGYGVGVATGDYDGDGDTDLYVTNVGPNVLLRNDGGGRFTDATAAAGVGDPGHGASAAFLDADLDGDLDLFVVNYVVWSERIERHCRNKLGEADYCDPNEYDAPAPDVLYRNGGAAPGGIVTFTDVSREAGLRAAFGNGLGVVVADFDGDRLPDVFVANDRTPDQLWIHLGVVDGGVRFEDRALVAGCATGDEGVAKAGMGVAARDLDGDGDRDLLVVNYSAESDSFFRNEGSYFVDATAAVGLKTASRPFTRFGLGLADFDNDGVGDLYEAAGRVARASPKPGDDPYAEPNLLFRGVRPGPGGGSGGGVRFAEVEPRGGTAELLAATSRAAAFGDVDNDGGVDVLVVNRDGPVHLLVNAVADRGHWIAFRVVGGDGGDALGATVRLEAGPRIGGRRSIVRDVRTASSYCAAGDPRIHVGLGAERWAREIAVEWPEGGPAEPFGDFEAGRIVTLRRGAGVRPSGTR